MGTTSALVIDQPMLELLKIDEETSLNITTDGKCLIVSPVQDENRRKKFEAALANGNKRFEKTFRRLAE